ncbi:MAG: hypothetical protein HZA89_03100 [Verrucomicrobia bacterium]|nr:hypothetical protein [Verrucomicrobiota bacterium]
MKSNLQPERPAAKRGRFYLWIGVALAQLAVFALLPIDPDPDRRFPHDCRGRLALVDEAVTQWSTNHNRGSLDVPDEQALRAYLRWPWMLHCPQGGRYTLGSLDLATTCDMHGHATLYSSASPAKAGSWLEEFSNSLKSKFDTGKIPEGQAVCVASLKVLDSATQRWAFEARKVGTNQIVPAELVVLLRSNALPHCPAGGKYLLRTIAEPPGCTVRGHGI